MLLKVRILIVSPIGRSDKKEATAFLSCASAVPSILIESSKQTGDDRYEYGRSESSLNFYRKDSDADWALWEEEA